MARIRVYNEKTAGKTALSNRFIDEYMKDANDAQLKIYIYLTRMISSGKAISVSEIADVFNHTEKDVSRALKYWEKKGLMSLEYDSSKNLVSIDLKDVDQVNAVTEAHGVPDEVIGSVTTVSADHQNIVYGNNNSGTASDEAVPVIFNDVYDTERNEDDNNVNRFAKPRYSAEQLKAFKADESFSQLFFLGECYLGHALSDSELKTIAYFKDVLNFSNDLIDHLIAHCAEIGKRDMKYIEKVALNWAENGIDNPQKANACSSKYEKNVYTIMNELGKSSSPTKREMEYINRWTKDYGFDMEIILEACGRTVMATDRHRFEYAESILANWKSQNVIHKTDILQLDETYKKKRTTNTTRSNVTSANKFNQFKQNDYDFADLEKKLLKL
ncbi:MAG: DnaD domain protein [Acetatifactor sp.]|nr:DnaD domain protein [Acetatifactor sp.]